MTIDTVNLNFWAVYISYNRAMSTSPLCNSPVCPLCDSEVTIFKFSDVSLHVCFVGIIRSDFAYEHVYGYVIAGTHQIVELCECTRPSSWYTGNEGNEYPYPRDVQTWIYCKGSEHDMLHKRPEQFDHNSLLARRILAGRTDCPNKALKCQPPLRSSVDCRIFGSTLCYKCEDLNRCCCGRRISSDPIIAVLESCKYCARSCKLCKKLVRDANSAHTLCAECNQSDLIVCWSCGKLDEKFSEQFPFGACLDCEADCRGPLSTAYQYLLVKRKDLCVIQKRIEYMATLFRVPPDVAAYAVITVNADPNLIYFKAFCKRIRKPFKHFEISRSGISELAFYYAATLLPREVFFHILKMIEPVVRKGSNGYDTDSGYDTY